jgi:hypothetical protein
MPSCQPKCRMRSSTYGCRFPYSPRLFLQVLHVPFDRVVVHVPELEGKVSEAPRIAASLRLEDLVDLLRRHGLDPDQELADPIGHLQTGGVTFPRALCRPWRRIASGAVPGCPRCDLILELPPREAVLEASEDLLPHGPSMSSGHRPEPLMQFALERYVVVLGLVRALLAVVWHLPLFGAS